MSSLQRLERHAGLLGDAGRRVAGLDRVRLALLGRLLLRLDFVVAVERGRRARAAPELAPAGSRASWTTEYSAKTKATSAIGARNRAGLRRHPEQVYPSPHACSRRRSASSRAASGGDAPAFWCALAIEREAVTSPPARPGAKAGRERRDVAALGADARAARTAWRHQLSQAREVLRLRRPRDGADVAEAGTASPAQLGDHLREALPQPLAAGQLEVHHVRRAGVRRAHAQPPGGVGSHGARCRSSRSRISDHAAPSRSHTGRSSTTPAAVRSAPTRAGQPGCRPVSGRAWAMGRTGQARVGRNDTATLSSTVSSVTCSGSTISPLQSASDDSRWVPAVPSGWTR